MSVGKSIRHDSAVGHVTGESIFIDDRPMLKNEVLVGVLGTPVSAGKIKKLITQKLLKLKEFSVFIRLVIFPIINGVR